MHSFWAFLWSFSLIFVLVFTFAVMGIELVGQHAVLLADEETREIADEQLHRRVEGRLGAAGSTGE